MSIQDLIDNHYMSVAELIDLIAYIQEKHTIGALGGVRWVKYVIPSYDTRTGCIFAITLDETRFSITNDTMGENLNTWVRAWLAGEDCARPYKVKY